MRREVRSGAPFELEGFWWAHGDGEDDVEPAYGRIRYQPETGLVLELVEWQGLIRQGADAGEIDVLYGQTLKGAPCTIFNAISLHRQSHLPGGHSKGEWRSSMMAHGAWIRDPEAVPVREVVIAWRGLAEWFISPAYGPGGGRRGMEPDSDPLVVRIGECTITLEFDWTQVQQQLEHRKTWTAAAKVESSGPKPLAEIQQRYLTPLRDLLIFGTAEETATESLALVGLADIESELIDHAGQRVEMIVQDATRRSTERKARYRHLLMPLGAWRDHQTLIERWLHLHARLGRAATLLFATLNSRPAHIENWFLNLAMFAEVYHRTLHDDPPLTPDEHERAVGSMLDALSNDELRNHYRPRLKYADQQGFHSRMKHLFRRAESAIDDIKE